MYDPKCAHVEMLESGLWAILNPDGSRFDAEAYRTRGAALRELDAEADRTQGAAPRELTGADAVDASGTLYTVLRNLTLLVEQWGRPHANPRGVIDETIALVETHHPEIMRALVMSR